MSLADVQNSMALPASAQLKLRPTGVPARRTRINIQPYQQPGSATDIQTSQLLQFYVPSRRGTMYDPQTMYLKGTIYQTHNAGGAGTLTNLNRNAFSLINRLQVYGQDSTLLEDIQNYNDLCNTLLDVQMSREDKVALSTMYAGSSEAYALHSNQAAAAPQNTGDVDTPYTRLKIKPAADTGTLWEADADEVHFCIPIVSSFGLLADTLIPVGWLGSDLRFDFYTEVPSVAFRAHTNAYGGAAAVDRYRLKNLELVMDQVTFEGEALSMVSEFAPPSGPLYLHASSYRTYSSTLSGAVGGGDTGYMNFMIPHRSLSVKQVLVTAHRATVTDGYDAFARVCPFGGGDFQLCLNIGGEKFPQKPINNFAEMFAELQKSQHSYNQLILNGSIDCDQYNVYNAGLTDIADSLQCKNVIGFDTETWDKKGSTIINGQNWTGLNVFLQGNVSNDLAQGHLTNNLSLHSFVNFDVIYVIQDGVISLRF